MRKMFPALERSDEYDEDTLSLSAGGEPFYYFALPILSYLPVAERAIVDNQSKATKEQLLTFLNIARTKYVKAKIEPGMKLSSL